MSNITSKPWGFEQLVECNDKYVVKLLYMKQGHKCSLQLHEKKHETITVMSGLLKLYYGENKNDLKEVVLSQQESFVIPTGLIHRMEGVSDCFYLECSTPELDDVIRLQDDYGR